MSAVEKKGVLIEETERIPHFDELPGLVVDHTKTVEGYKPIRPRGIPGPKPKKFSAERLKRIYQGEVGSGI